MQQSSMAKKDVPLQKEAYVWLMRDGASTHFSAAERIFLNDAYPDRDGCIVWLSRSQFTLAGIVFMEAH